LNTGACQFPCRFLNIAMFRPSLGQIWAFHILFHPQDLQI
jgi:hypothetical protein